MDYVAFETAEDKGFGPVCPLTNAQHRRGHDGCVMENQRIHRPLAQRVSAIHGVVPLDWTKVDVPTLQRLRLSAMAGSETPLRC